MILLKQIQLPNGRSTMNLGFGCAGILRLPTARHREYLLKTAVEGGITHFDVARMYGLGAAEGIVGSSLKSFKDQITIATKFGMPYADVAPASLKTQSIARWILSLSPSLKSTIKKLLFRRRSSSSSSIHQPASAKNYSIAEMERSLNLSLQRLQMERVDLFYLHAPEINDAIPDDLSEALQQKKVSGEIGAYGISGYPSELEYFLRERPDICGEAIQYQYSIFGKNAENQLFHRPFTGRFGVIDGTHQRLYQYLSDNKNFTKSWSSLLDIELEDRENVGIIILAMALALNPQGMVLFFTSNPKRLRHTIHRLTDNSFSEENLLKFRKAIMQGDYAN
jgi:aryl-alcohol dehydrogenase-like predicted oxidoreductase